MNIQWFPGHMAKTRRLITENLKLVDVVIELLDARIPISSSNPELKRLINNKPRVVVFNKSDLADPVINKEWENHYKSLGEKIVFVNSLKGSGVNRVKTEAISLMKDEIDRLRAKGRIFKTIRTMVVGIPNVGKSSFINRLSGRAATQTGNRPGITKNKQWIRLNKDIELLDTPGILWPKFDNKEIGLNLAFTGAIKDEIIDIPELACLLLERLANNYPQDLTERFKLDIDVKEATGLEILEEAGRKRGCIISKGQINYMRIAIIVLDEFRGGKIGKISLERPEDEKSKYE